ncbi:unnamed protein product, partial [Meganyctiphanes norvegica]
SVPSKKIEKSKKLKKVDGIKSTKCSLVKGKKKTQLTDNKKLNIKKHKLAYTMEKNKILLKSNTNKTKKLKKDNKNSDREKNNIQKSSEDSVKKMGKYEEQSNGSSEPVTEVGSTSGWRCELVPHKDHSSSVKWDVNYY